MREADDTGASHHSRPEERSTHCVRLGGTVPLGYCLFPGQDLPCRKILDCWWQGFDIHGYLKERFSPGIIKRITEQPGQDRLGMIADLVKSFENQ